MKKQATNNHVNNKAADVATAKRLPAREVKQYTYTEEDLGEGILDLSVLSLYALKKKGAFNRNDYNNAFSFS